MRAGVGRCLRCSTLPLLLLLLLLQLRLQLPLRCWWRDERPTRPSSPVAGRTAAAAGPQLPTLRGGLATPGDMPASPAPLPAVPNTDGNYDDEPPPRPPPFVRPAPPMDLLPPNMAAWCPGQPAPGGGPSIALRAHAPGPWGCAGGGSPRRELRTACNCWRAREQPRRGHRCYSPPAPRWGHQRPRLSAASVQTTNGRVSGFGEDTMVQFRASPAA